MAPRFGLFALVLLSASMAFGQRVVILEIDGDKGGKLRDQVEAALRKADTVDVVSIDKYKSVAAKKKLKGTAAMTAAGVSRIARGLKLDAAVGGDVDSAFNVTIWDSAGQQLWTKELKTKKGMLSPDFANKLARAITAAAKTAPKPEEDTEGDDDEGAPKKSAHVGENTEEDPNAAPRQVARRKNPNDEAKSGEEAAEEANAQPERDQDLENEGKKVKNKIGPKVVSVWVAGTTTWRSYCARPGVGSCGEYDGLSDKPVGDIVDFRPQVPYAGFNIEAEVFPLAAFLNNAAQGLGVVGSFGLGFSLTNVTVDSTQGTAKCPDGNEPPCPVVSTDKAWSAALAYRYYFSFWPDAPAKLFSSGFVGLRVGAAGRIFEIDPKAQVPLPGANRVYALIGLDAMIPIIKFLNIELGGQFFINPRPGPDETSGYGDASVNASGQCNAQSCGSSGLGFQLQGGLSGTIWGPVGYKVMFRYTSYTDHFYGVGNKWTQTTSGAAAEQYMTIFWGITASF